VLSIVTLVLLVTYSWFRSALVIAYAEPGLYFFNSNFQFDQAWYVWTDKIATGASFGLPLASIPFHLGFLFLQSVGLSPLQKQATFFVSMLSLSGLSMYYLVTVALNARGSRREVGIASVFAGIFYVFNPYSMVYVWNRNTVSMIVAYAVLPLALALFIHGLSSKDPKFAFYNAAALTLTSIWTSVVPVLIPALLSSYLLFHLWVHRANRKEIYSSVRYSSVVAVLWSMMNFWYLPNFALNLNRIWWGPSTNYAQQFPTGFPITDVLRLNFYFYSNAVIWPFYQTPLGVLLSLIMVTTVFAYVGFRLVKYFGTIRKGKSLFRTNPGNLAYFGILAVTGVFLGTVANSPLRGPFSLLLGSLPLSALITNNLVGEKAVALAAVAYSVLFGLTMLSVHNLLSQIKKPRRKTFRKILNHVAIVALASVVIVANVWPLWTGDVFTQPNIPSTQKLGLVNVPDYYAQASAWLDNDTRYFRVLTLPLVSGGITYTWEPYGYSGATTDFVLLPKPVIMEAETLSVPNQIVNSVDYMINSGQTKDLSRFLSLLNVRYIMVHEDINFTDRHTANPLALEMSLNSSILPYVNVKEMLDNRGDPITKSTNSWTITWGGPPESLINGTDANGGSDITYKGRSDTTTGYFGFGPNFDPPLNLSTVKWLDLSLNSTVSGKIEFIFTDGNGRQMFFDGRSSPIYQIYDSQRWVNFSLPLKNPSYQNQGLNLSDIHSVLVALVSTPPNAPVEIKTRNWFLDWGQESSVPGVKYQKTIGKLAFYALENTNDLIYGTDTYSLVSDPYTLVRELPALDYRTDSTLFISSNIGNISSLRNLSLSRSEVPFLSFHQVNPTKWVVEVRNSKAPFVLVFGQSFDPNWKLYFTDPGWIGSFFMKPLDERLHYLANDYANAWYIDKKGDFMITIYNSAQSFVYAGIAVSLATSASAFVALFGARMRQFAKRALNRIVKHDLHTYQKHRHWIRFTAKKPRTPSSETSRNDFRAMTVDK
jgi:hypothetical protein